MDTLGAKPPKRKKNSVKLNINPPRNMDKGDIQGHTETSEAQITIRP